MSRTRIPDEVTDVLLIVHYRDGFCTVQAVFDATNAYRRPSRMERIVMIATEKFNLIVRSTPNSDYVSRALAAELAKRWLDGQYIVVEHALLPGHQQRDWLS